MAGQLKLRRGTTSQLANYTGSEGELTYNTTLKSLVLHDGVTLGGVKIPYLSNNLVPSAMLPTATESVVGASKIATTAIARAGTNDTDFITAKKLRDALNTVGNAPVSACRAYVVYSLTGGVVTIRKAFNVSSVVRNSVGNCTITFATPMTDANYPFSAKGTWYQDNIYAGDAVTARNSIKTANQLQVVGINRAQGTGDPTDLTEICVIVF